MGVQVQTAAILAVSACFRLLIFLLLPGIPDALTARVEISTPVSSFKRLQEGLFLYQRGVSPYDGGVYHQAPLLLAIFELLPASLIYTALDLLNGYSLGLIAERIKVTSPRFQKLNTSTITAAYLFNPFTILSCLGRSTTIFTSAAMIQAVASAMTGNAFGAMFATAIGTCLSMYPALLLPPLLLLQRQYQQQPLTSAKVINMLGSFAGVLVLLLGASALLVGNFQDFLTSCYGAQITVTDLTPNVGLWWYFFIEIFDAFRDFFIGVFWLHLVGYVGALTVRLPEQPLFVITSLLGLIAIFKPYPSIADISLYLGFLPLYGHVMPCMYSFRNGASSSYFANFDVVTRYTFVAASVLLYATLLGPAFHYIWIYAGSGNANFFYAITLVWSLGLSILVGDTLYAVLRDEWEMERPEMRGKDVRQI